MNVRLDTELESWGGFTTGVEGAPIIHGLLRYQPAEGIALTLVENPGGPLGPFAGGKSDFPVLYGRLVDGTALSLFGCFVTNASIQVGIGYGSPTTLHVNRALFGLHAQDLDALRITEYSAELSSLANWTGSRPVTVSPVAAEQETVGFDLSCRQPEPIRAPLPEFGRTLQVRLGVGTRSGPGELAAVWSAANVVTAPAGMTLDEGEQTSFQCRNLMALLVGAKVSVRALQVTPEDVTATGGHRTSLSLLYTQRGRHDHPDVLEPLMLLPYRAIWTEFPAIVKRWFARSEQSILATNVFFGAQYLDRHAGPAHFLSVVQAAESYHRSLGTGVYMDQAAYDAAVADLTTHIPATIAGDHRQSLKSRLRWGNEFSLRKRCGDLFSRLPLAVQRWIASDVPEFLKHLVATRNYYTHYDCSAREDILTPVAAHWAAERLRILVVANLLHDLGVRDDELLAVLQRSQEFVQIVLQR